MIKELLQDARLSEPDASRVGTITAHPTSMHLAWGTPITATAET
jgi:hypothetical protein